MRALILLPALLLFLSACVDAKNKVADKKVLIVYLSRTNNTKAIAQIIQKNIGGDLVAVELEKPYPTDYKATVDQVAHENETGYLPPLKTKIGNIEKYDVVFVGFPTWGMQLPPPMKSFLNEHNLSGKTVIPFNTNGGYGVGSTIPLPKKEHLKREQLSQERVLRLLSPTLFKILIYIKTRTWESVNPINCRSQIT